MIKFFRKIRKNLLNEGKTKKYFKYAIGEIVLVVIGILIALQINTWNAKRKKKEILKNYLINLVHDLKQDQIKMNGLQSNHGFRYHSMQYLLKVAGLKQYDPKDDSTEIPKYLELSQSENIWDNEIPKKFDKDFVQLAFLWTHRVPNFSYNDHTRNELKSTGMYAYLEQGIKVELNSYYDIWNAYFKEIVLKLREDWELSLGEEGLLNSEVYLLDKPLELIKNNPHRQILMKRIIRESGWVIKGTIIMSKKNENLILTLEKKIHELE